ncbi:hypothetical protein CTI12_AA452730 [Artemisia annua]|uniref:Uncharacterized protein n=1 Tax=Artemisia annua TaxID=35608 RepID=A0A2U1LUF5_ARTAN|nr:hypothetical protein CTI12_AA452730 [Artemisia annua]
MASVRGQAQKVALKEQETIARQNEDIETKSTNHHTSKEFKDLKLEPMSSMESSKKFSKQKKGWGGEGKIFKQLVESTR